MTTTKFVTPVRTAVGVDNTQEPSLSTIHADEDYKRATKSEYMKGLSGKRHHQSSTEQGSSNGVSSPEESEDDIPQDMKLHRQQSDSAVMLDEFQAETEHLHLSSDMQKKIDAIQSLIKEFRTANEKYFNEHDKQVYVREARSVDEFVYRFLTARNNNVQAASKMFQEAVAYRQRHNIDTILDRNCPHAEELMMAAKQAVHRQDKQGRPVLIEQVGSQAAKEMYEKYGFEGRCYYHQFLMEYLTRVLLPELSKQKGERITQVVIVIDMKGLNFGQVFKTNYQYVKYVAKINSLLYPEYLAITYVIGCPRMFSVCWNIVKGWLDEKTRKKISIIHGNGLKETTTLIDSKNYPKVFGGSCTCKGCQTGPLQDTELTMEFRQHLKKLAAKQPTDSDETVDDLSQDVMTRMTTGS